MLFYRREDVVRAAKVQQAGLAAAAAAAASAEAAATRSAGVPSAVAEPGLVVEDAARRAARREQLDDVIGYCEGLRCRRSVLLAHFASEPAAHGISTSNTPACCDNCARAAAAAAGTSARTAAPAAAKQPPAAPVKRRVTPSWREAAAGERLDGAALSQLQRLRAALARETGLRPAHVLSAKVLEALARARPVRREDVARIVGGKRAAAYGDRIVALFTSLPSSS